MAYQKCPACDGWGTRKKPRQHPILPDPKCPACAGTGLVGYADLTPVPWAPPPDTTPFVPWMPPTTTPTWPYGTTARGDTICLVDHRGGHCPH